MDALVQLGDSVSAEADQTRRENDQGLLGRGDERGHTKRHQREERGAELKDPVDQANGVWLSQS